MPFNRFLSIEIGTTCFVSKFLVIQGLDAMPLTQEDIAEVRAIVSDMLLTPATVFANISFPDGLVIAFKNNVRVPHEPRIGESGFYIKPLKAVVVDSEYNTYKDRFRIQLGDPETKEEGIVFNKPFDHVRFLNGMGRYGWIPIQCCHQRDIRFARSIEARLPRCKALTVNNFYGIREDEDEQLTSRLSGGGRTAWKTNDG